MSRSARARGVMLGVILTVMPAMLMATVQAQALRSTSSGYLDAAASIESVALEAFAGPDRSGKDGPLAPVGLELARIYAASSVPGGLEALRTDAGVAGAPTVRGDRVLIDATAVGSGTELLRDLEALGLRNGVAFGRVVSGELPIEALPQAAALTRLKRATPARAARSVGAVDSQADVSMRADASRLAFGIDGSGVAVGTLSDSYDCSGSTATSAADDVASGDLPAGVTVLQELATCPGGIDEGRAMMQLIHDVAPGASQLFHTAFGGQAVFAQGIIDLEAAGADVIVDDVYYFAEPMFQDGIIAQAADQVVAAGVPYFSSVGNQADASYQAAFRPTPKPAGFAANVSDTVHDFDPGPGVDAVQQIVVAPGATFTLILQWDDPFASAGVGNPGAAGDVDLFVTDTAGSTIFVPSTDDNIAGGDPVEILQVTNNGGTPASAGIVIGFYGGVQPGTVKYLFLGDMSVEEHATNSATGFGHPNAAGAVAVGAAYYDDTPEFGQDPPLREAFTSLGGVPIFFDVDGNRLATPEQRPKPEITAPDGTDTTFFGFDSDGTGFPNFFGTSAAAPHAAAVAALLLEQAPDATPAEIRTALQATAIDMDAPGFDPWTGFGLIQADQALQSRAGSVGFAAASYAVDESAGTVTLAVQRTGGTAGAISVDYATSDGTATAGSDYTATTGTLTWPDGDATSRTIDVPLTDDTDPEGDETLDVTLDQPIGTTIDQAQATVTVLANDPPGTVGFVAPSYDAAEASGSVTITVPRTGGTAGAISVDYATSDGTATAPDDYTTTSGTLTWSDGDATPKTIDVPILDDTDPEGDETLDVTLDQPIGTTIDQAQTTITILEDDAAIVSVAKGSASPAAALRSGLGEAVTVLQLALSVPSVAQQATIDSLEATVTVEGSAGAPTDVEEVRLYFDADGDGAIDAGSDPVAVAAPNADGSLALVPTGLTVAAGEEHFLLVELVFGGSLASLPAGAPLAALAVPFLIGVASTRRRRLVGLALLLLVVVAACSGPPPRSADVTTEIVALDASSAVPGVDVTTSGLPVAGSTVTVTE